MESIVLEYVSAGCNRSPNCMSWGKNNLIAYATCNAVAIYDPFYTGMAGKVTQTLVSHSDKVVFVKWLDETTLVSSSVDRTAVLWKLAGGRYEVLSTLEGHGGTVHVVDAFATPDGRSLFASASTDSTLRFWSGEGETVSETQAISLRSGFVLNLRFATLPRTDDVVLFASRDDSTITIYKWIGELFEEAVILDNHSDWVRGLDVMYNSLNQLMLLSSAQDGNIMIHKVFPAGAFEAEKTDDSASLKLKQKTIQSKDLEFVIVLESVITGHDDKVYDVKWLNDGSLTFLSSSMDKTMIVWKLDCNSGSWLEDARVGEVGGNTLGFYGCAFGPDGGHIIGQSFNGAFHMWSYDEEAKMWQPQVTVSGHFDEVNDLCWEETGKYFISTSKDQTTRLHGRWTTKATEAGSKNATWHEIARPQVHGYDINCIASLPDHRFVSGADEKVVRIFEAPSMFHDALSDVCGHEDRRRSNGDARPQGASVPSLGLSNKAVFEGESSIPVEQRHVGDQYPDHYFTPERLGRPPPEESLVQNTLWPEIHKLYGHGYEIFALASCKDLVASVCKAQKAEHAAIMLWSTRTWQKVDSLTHHTLTVTQMAFSPCAGYLLAVSRDRTWSLYRRDPDDSFQLHAFSDKKCSVHQRIIWSCGWSLDSKYFVTGSRDKKVVLWTRGDQEQPSDAITNGYHPTSSPLSLKESVTAVAFSPVKRQNDYLLAVGLETGEILLYFWSEKVGFNLWKTMEKSLAHHKTVKRLLFCVVSSESGNVDTVHLTSCSLDHSVRMFKVYLGNV